MNIEGFQNFALHLAVDAPAGTPAQPSPWPTFGMMALMIVIFYFLLIRPQRLRQKELERRIGALKTGDRVVTAGGIHGMVTNVKERTVMLRIAENVRIEVEKSSISTTIPKESGDVKDEGKGEGKAEAKVGAGAKEGS
jgi:preprotein translocase subunit YajC